MKNKKKTNNTDRTSLIILIISIIISIMVFITLVISSAIVVYQNVNKDTVSTISTVEPIAFNGTLDDLSLEDGNNFLGWYQSSDSSIYTCSNNSMKITNYELPNLGYIKQIEGSSETRRECVIINMKQNNKDDYVLWTKLGWFAAMLASKEGEERGDYGFVSNGRYEKIEKTSDMQQKKYYDYKLYEGTHMFWSVPYGSNRKVVKLIIIVDNGDSLKNVKTLYSEPTSFLELPANKTIKPIYEVKANGRTVYKMPNNGCLTGQVDTYQEPSQRVQIDSLKTLWIDLLAYYKGINNSQIRIPINKLSTEGLYNIEITYMPLFEGSIAIEEGAVAKDITKPLEQKDKFSIILDYVTPIPSSFYSLAQEIDIPADKIGAVQSGLLADKVEVNAKTKKLDFTINQFSEPITVQFTPYTIRNIKKSSSIEGKTIEWIEGELVRGVTEEVKPYDGSTLHGLGKYKIVVTDIANRQLILNIDNTVTPSNLINYTEENACFYPNTNTSNLIEISEVDYSRGLRAYTFERDKGGILVSKKINNRIVSFDTLTENMLNKVELRLPNGEVIQTFNNIACDKLTANIDNATDLQAKFGFDGSVFNTLAIRSNKNASAYLGVAKEAVTFTFTKEMYETTEILSAQYKAYTRNADGTISVANDYITPTLYNASGEYIITISDKYNQTLTLEFAILLNGNSINEYILGHNMYLAPQYYRVSVPASFPNWTVSGYTNTFSNDKTYLFGTEDKAKTFAIASEFNVCVREANGGFYYRANNSGSQIFYKTRQTLDSAIEQSVKKYIKRYEYKANSSQSIGVNEVVLDNEILFNTNGANTGLTINTGTYIINKDFMFNTSTYSGSYRYTKKVIVNGNEANPLNLSLTFGENVNGLTGEYTLTEYDNGGNAYTYKVYLDNSVPSVNITYKRADIGKVTIPYSFGDTISLYVEKFRINSILDSDKFAAISISGKGLNGIYYGNSPILSNVNGNYGAYDIVVYDRSNNKMAFTVNIAEQAPTVTMEIYGVDEGQYALFGIDKGRNVIVGLEVYKSVLVNGELAYQLVTEGSDNAVISINSKMCFKSGGNYKFIITDNYGRSTEVIKRFAKGMPSITLKGVKNGYSNKDVTAIIPSTAQYEIKLNGVAFTGFEVFIDSVAKERTMLFRANNNNNGLYTIKVYFTGDEANFNEVSFSIDTIAPIITAKRDDGTIIPELGVVNCGVRLAVDGKDYDRIEYTLNGRRQGEYNNNLLTAHGSYQAFVYDRLGNYNVINFTIDIAVDYEIAYKNNKYIETNESLNGARIYVAQGFSIDLFENATILIINSRGEVVPYTTGSVITTAGLYDITITDTLNNVIKLAVDVRDTLSGITFLDSDNKELKNNAKIKTSFRAESSNGIIDNARYRYNGKSVNYVFGAVLKDGGTYDFTITDKLGNVLNNTIIIDNVVEYRLSGKTMDISKLNEGRNYKLSDGFVITTNEEVTYVATRDKVAFDFVGEGKLEGEYNIKMTDKLGNIAYLDIIVRTSAYGVNMTDGIGDSINNGNITKSGFIVSWTDESYIKKVEIKSGRYSSSYAKGTLVTARGEYQINFTDILDNVYQYTVTVDNSADFEIAYDKEYITDRLLNNVTVVLTRSFTITSNEELTIKLTCDGRNIIYNVGELFSVDGIYTIDITDKLGNQDILAVEIRGGVKSLDIMSNNSKIEYNAVTRYAFNVNWDKEHYIAKASYKSGRYYYDYSKGLVLNEHNKYYFLVEDVLGNTREFTIDLDTKVDYTAVGRLVEQNVINNGHKVWLSDGLTLNKNEEIAVVMTKNGVVTDYVFGSKLSQNGVYVFVLTDNVGNEETLIVDVRTSLWGVVIKDTDGATLKYGSITNKNFFLTWTEDAKVKSVSVRGKNLADYVKESIISKHGKYEFFVLDMLGNEYIVSVELDNIVDYTLNGKTVGMSDRVVTKALSITLNEECEMVIKLGDVILEGREFTKEGVYSIVIKDIIGNVKELNVEVRNTLHDVTVYGEDKKAIEDIENVKTNFFVKWIDNGYIKKVMCNNYKYANAEIVTRNGYFNFVFTDILDNDYNFRVGYDNVLELNILGKMYDMSNDNSTLACSQFKLTADEEVTMTATRDNALYDIMLDTNIDKDGKYSIDITDTHDNKRSVTIIVDKVAPEIQADTDKVTNKDIKVSVSDKSKITEVLIYKDGKVTDLSLDENNAITLVDHGKYKIVATDIVKNSVTKNLDIDKLVDLEKNTYNNGYSNGSIYVDSKEKINYVVTYNDKVLEYALGKQLTDIGKYVFTATDELGNSITLNFSIIPKRYSVKTLTLDMVDGQTVTRNDIEYIPTIIDGTSTFSEDGKYTITTLIGKDKYSYDFEIDNSAPIVTGNVENGSLTRNEVTLDIENGTTILVYRDGKEISQSASYSLLGNYKIVVTDMAGNVNEFCFEIKYSMNVASILAIITSIGIACALVFFLIKNGRRKALHKSKINKLKLQNDSKIDK